MITTFRPGIRRASTPAVTAVVCLALGALNDLSREVGGALGIAVIGSVVTAVYRSNLHLTGVPASLADKARGSFALAIHAGGPVKATAGSAFTDGLHTGLLYAAGAALLAAITVAVLLAGQRRRQQGGRQVAGDHENRQEQAASPSTSSGAEVPVAAAR